MTSWNKNGNLSGGLQYFRMLPPMEVIPNSSFSALQEEQQQSGMVIKYHSESPFTFFIFSKMTEAVCEDRDRYNAPTHESHSQFVAPSCSLEQEPSLKEIDSRDILLLTEADVPGASLNNEDPSEPELIER